jgi:uncharacterized protein (DUF983 family)
MLIFFNDETRPTVSLPRCGEGRLYRSLYNLNLNDRCPNCGLNLADNDSADGPAVFLIFILGFLLVPAAVLLDWAFSPPLWLHAILWGLLALMVTVGALKPLKSLVSFNPIPDATRNVATLKSIAFGTVWVGTIITGLILGIVADGPPGVGKTALACTN